MDIRAPDQRYNPYRIFSREQWAELRNDTPMTLEPGEFSRLRSMHDRLDLKEVEEIYLPLSRLLSIYVDAAQRLYYAQRQFLGIRDRKVPYIIGIAGSANSTSPPAISTSRFWASWSACVSRSVRSTCGRQLHLASRMPRSRSGSSPRWPSTSRCLGESTIIRTRGGQPTSR
jgi:hypothetical protein